MWQQLRAERSSHHCWEHAGSTELELGWCSWAEKITSRDALGAQSVQHAGLFVAVEDFGVFFAR